jgi:hypothetical protein
MTAATSPLNLTALRLPEGLAQGSTGEPGIEGTPADVMAGAGALVGEPVCSGARVTGPSWLAQAHSQAPQVIRRRRR